MFTGIVEEIGKVVELRRVPDLLLWDGSRGEGTELAIECTRVLEGASLGCSIAVNGTCLTVVSFTSGVFRVNLAPETLRRTNLGLLRQGDGVNLERAMGADQRNSGHMVQGHIDETGTVFSTRRDGDSLWIVIKTSPATIKYIVPKGFVAIDGTSLTVCDVDRAACTFSFMLVPHTQQSVIMPRKSTGDLVNIEVDVISKYVEASMHGVHERLADLERKVGGGASSAPAASTTSAPAAVVATVSHQGVIPGLEVHTPAATSQAGADREIAAIHAQVGTGGGKQHQHQQQQAANKTVHGEGLRVPMPTTEEAKSLRIGIVRTCWHEGLVCLLESKCIDALVAAGVLRENIVQAVCPGSYELPYTTKVLLDNERLDAVVAIGILIKGGTIHMEVIANAVTTTLMEMQLQHNTPIVFGVLTTLSIEQAQERAESALGWSWGESALCQAMIRRKYAKK